MISEIKADLVANRERCSFPSFVKNLLFNPGFQLALLHRLASSLYRRGSLGRVLSLAVWRLGVHLTSCHLNRTARISPGVYFPHPVGIVIGSGCVVEEGVTIYQNVTLGRKDVARDDYPTVRSGTVLCTGAQLLGKITIGRNCIVAANTIVMQDIPDGSVVYGFPNKIKKVGT